MNETESSTDTVTLPLTRYSSLSNFEIHLIRLVDRVRRIKGIHLRIWSARPNPHQGRFVFLAHVVPNVEKKKRCVHKVARVDKFTSLLLALDSSIPRGFISDEKVERFFTPLGMKPVKDLAFQDRNYDYPSRQRLKRLYLSTPEWPEYDQLKVWDEERVRAMHPHIFE